MSRVFAKDLASGMRLARPVVNDRGLVLIAEGTELTDFLIARIRQLDLGPIYIHGVSRVLPPKAEAMADLERRFRKVEAAPHMALVKNAILRHLEALYEDNGPKDSKGKD